MADVIMGQTEIDAVSQTLISSVVQEQLIQNAILLPTISDYSALAVPGLKAVDIPRAGGFTVNDKVENTAVDAQDITYATDALALDKFKVIQVLLEKNASLQSRVNALADMAPRAGKALALQIDTDIITALVATSSSAPDHRIALAGSTFAAADILAARKLLNDQNVPLTDRWLAIPTAYEADMLAISQFILSSSFGNAQAQITGQIGQVYGFNVIVHTGLSHAVAYHKSHVGFAMQQAVSYQSMLDLPNLAMRHSWDLVYSTPKTMDSGKRGVLIGSAT